MKKWWSTPSLSIANSLTICSWPKLYSYYYYYFLPVDFTENSGKYCIEQTDVKKTS